MSRIYSPGKIWRRKNSINLDCGLVFNVTNYNESFAKFGNLAAYHIEADEALYLWDIVESVFKIICEITSDQCARELWQNSGK